MAALAADRKTPLRSGEFRLVPVAAATVIYAGAMVARDSSGNAVPAADTAGLVVLGRAEARADNSLGAAGDVSVTIREGVFAYAHSGLTLANVGKPVFALDDQTVGLSSTNGVYAGTLIDVSDEGAWIEIDVDDRAAAAQSDSVATTAGGIVADFNALLANLRAARILAS